MSRIFPIAFRSTVLTLAVACLTTSLIAAEQEETVLNQKLLLPSTGVNVSRPVHATNLTYGMLNFDLLEQLATGSTFEIELAGKQFEALVVESKTQMYGRTVKGVLTEQPESFFAISTDGIAAAGTFLVPGKRLFQLSYGGEDGLHYVAQPIETKGLCGLDQGDDAGAVKNAVPPVHRGQGFSSNDVFRGQTKRQNKRTDSSESTNLLGGCAVPPPQFDIAIAYTQAARIRVGSVNAIRTEIMNAVTIAEQTYQNSGLSIEVNLVGLAEINYAENASINQDLINLVNGTGILQQARDLRTDTGADFLALVVSEGQPIPDSNSRILGIATCPNNPNRPPNFWFDNSSINAVRFGANPIYTGNELLITLIHEMGHNVGCNHTEGLCNPTEPTARALSTTDFETIMGNQGAFTRILHYSNPNVQFEGVPTGNGSRNNFAEILSREREVESSMPSRVNVFVDSSASGTQDGSFQNPFDTVLEGVNQTLPAPVADLPELFIGAGFYDESFTITKPMIIRSCGGTASIGN